jgi:hypothetical protein
MAGQTNTHILITDNYGAGQKHFLDCSDANIPITYSIADVRDIGKRNSPYTKTINLPGSKNNKKLFTNNFNINSAGSFNPIAKTSCVIISNDLPILYGYLQLTAINYIDQGEVEFEVLVYGQLADLAYALGDRLLDGNVDSSGAPLAAWNLSFQEMAHLPTEANVSATWDAAKNSDDLGYIYAHVDLGDNWNLDVPGFTLADYPIVPLKELYPWIYAKRIWDKIFSSVGYTYTSTFVNTNLFKKLFVLGEIAEPGSSAQMSTDTQLSHGIAGQNYTILNFDSGINAATNQWRETRYSMVLNTLTYSGKAFAFVPPSNGDYIFKLKANFTVTASAPDSIYIKLIDENGNVIPTAPTGGYLYNVTSTFTGTAATFTSPGTAVKYNLNGGSNYFILVEIYHPGYTTADVQIMNGATIDVQNINGIDLKYMLPRDMKQIDFITSIVKMFNLVVVPDFDNPTNLIVETRDHYYSTGRLLDWSNKIDRASDYKIYMASQLGGNVYNFSYTDDNDFLNDQYSSKTKTTYGQKVVHITNDFVKAQVEIKPVFAPTQMRLVPGFDNITNSNFVVPAIYSYDTSSHTPSRTNFKPRILMNNKVVHDWSGGLSSNVITYNFYDTGIQTRQSILYTSTDDGKNSISLNFDNPNGAYAPKPLYNKYYKNYVNTIASPNSKIMKAKFWLTTRDIYETKFNDKIYLEIEGCPSYWYINQIIDFNPATPQLTEVELIYVD